MVRRKWEFLAPRRRTEVTNYSVTGNVFDMVNIFNLNAAL